MHPGDLGCEVMAELASHLVASYALKAHLRAGAAGGSDAAAPAPPLREDAVFGADAEDDAVCVHSAALRPMETRDWRLVEEHDKWGLAATAAGAPLDVSFAPSEAGPGLFQLAYLESYDPAWGQVAVSCAGACSCAATIVDAHKEGGHTSVEAIARLPLSSRAGEGRCTVRLTLLGGRFKVLGVIASRRGACAWVGGEGGCTAADRSDAAARPRSQPRRSAEPQRVLAVCSHPSAANCRGHDVDMSMHALVSTFDTERSTVPCLVPSGRGA